MEEILAKLISFHSTNDDLQGRHEAIEYIAHFVQARGMHVARYEWDGFESLVATVKKDEKHPRILLAAHVDVVSGDDDMFVLQKADGNYYGRGVCDMKFAIAAYLHIIDTLQNQLPQYDIGLMITSDEEVGGKNGVDGAERLVKEGYRADMVILPDGGRDWQLETRAKGVARFNLRATGKTAHASRPWEGENAIFKLTRLLTDLEYQFRNQAANTDTMNVGSIHGGEAHNIVPAEAATGIEFRLYNEESLARCTKIITELCQKYDVDFENTMYWENIQNDMNHPYVKTFAQCIEAVTGVKNVGVASLGASDVRFFAKLGIPYATTYPIGGGLHSDEEWINEAAFYQFEQIVSDFLEKTARI